MGLMVFFATFQSFGQVSCDYLIQSFTMTPDPAPPADPIFPGCSPLGYSIIVNNIDVDFPTEDLTLTITVDPAQFVIDLNNLGGFAAPVATANPALPGYVDYVQTFVLQPEEQRVVQFQANVPSIFSNALDPTVDVRVFLTTTLLAAPAPPPVCTNIETERIVFIPEVVRQIGSNGSTYFLGSVALDNPNDNVTVLDQLYSVPGGNPSNLPRQEAVIRGNMIVDIPYQFSATSKLVLAEDAQIVINNGAAPLTILGTDIRGCATLWEHLLATTGGNLTLSNSTVRDGRNAVHVTGAGIANISGNTFTDNDAALLAVGEAKVSFGGNTVNSVAGLLPPIGNVQERPRVGIELRDVTVPVSIGAAGGNHFENLHNGIAAFGTTVDVRSSSFKKMLEGTVASLPFSGRGIHVENAGTDRTLTQRGLGFGASPTFDECAIGIFSSGTNIDVQDNKMVNVVVGVESQLAQTKDITIKLNDITASRTGINMFQNTRVRTTTIEDNKVNIQDPTTGLSNAMGIRCDENGGDASFAPQRYKILSNTVEVKGGRSGIFFSNASLALLKNNTVKNILSSTYSSGIYLDASYNTVVACNLLEGAGATSETRGLHVAGAYRTVARCNEATKHYLNINFEGATDNSALLGNKMNTAFHGFLLGSAGTPGMIGKQDYRGNKWMSGFTNYPASFPSASNSTQLEDNRFLIDPNFQPLSQFHPIGTQPPGWFIDQAPNPWKPTFDCGAGNSCPDGIGDEDYPEILDELDEHIADGDITSSFCTAAYKWTAQRHLYARLQRKPSLANGNLKMQNFMAAKAGTSIGQFEAIGQQINQMLMPPSADANQLGTNRETVGTKLGEIQAIETQLAGGTFTTQQVAQKRAQQAQLQQDIVALQAQSDGIVTNFNSQKSATTLSLMQQNAAIVANAVYEQNQQQVYDVFLRTVARGHANFSPGQLATLESIADQCYICGGDGVFLARSLYALADPNKLYNDDLLCGGQLIKREPSQGIHSDQFKVSPNPANTWALLESASDVELEGEIMLFDLSGRLISTEAITIGDGISHLLDLSNVSTGFYTVKVLMGGKTVHTDKLVITR